MKRNISVIYKILTAISLLTGITLNLYSTTSKMSLLSYYTSQSNIICLIAFVSFSIMEVRNKEKNDIYYLVKGAIVIMIFITTFFYHIALAPFGFNMEPSQNTFVLKKIANFFVHTCSPFLVILDYFLFDEKGNFKRYYPFLWLIFPLNYVIYVYTYASKGGTFYGIGGSKQFAYFFLDYQEIGIFGVIKWLIVMALGILLISYLLELIDKLLKKREITKKKGAH